MASAQDVDNPLRTLRVGHPRIIATQQDFARIREMIDRDPDTRELHQRILDKARTILDQPPVEYRIVGPRLLSQSRRCLDRVYTLALLYHLDGDTAFLDRAKNELYAAAAFPDWNPSHFLDTAEMTHAFAIGYDWLYHALSPDERRIIREAIVEKGFNAYLHGFETGAWWTRSTHNWNQVCHGGIGIGTLALADEEPELAATALKHAIQKLPLALAGYAPDGGWNEGPGYWHYATRYTVYFLAALESALGTEFGLADYQGLDGAGNFRIHFQGPLGESFNYADARSNVTGTHEMFWLARRFKRPVYAWHQRNDLLRPSALDLVWYQSEGNSSDLRDLPLDAFYRGIDVVLFRSAWEDRKAVFVGFKGGDNKANHSHLDLGSFVLDADGVRWAVDLGPDDYNLPSYFGSKRWTYFRLKTESHNTLEINGKNQKPSAAAPVTAFETGPDRSYAIAELTDAYEDCMRVRRGVALLDRRYVLVQDEIEANQPVDITWGILTNADERIDGGVATLEENGQKLQVKILSPKDARFEVISANPPKPQRQQPEAKRLVIRLLNHDEATRLIVLFTPYGGQTAPPVYAGSVVPLDAWKTP